MDYKMELTEQLAQPVLSMRTRTAVGNLPQDPDRTRKWNRFTRP